MTITQTRSAPPTSSQSPFGSLRRHGDAPALLAAGERLTYAELADRVEQRAAALGSERRLLLLECRNTVETVVAYLAALEAGHPVILVGPDCPRDELEATYGPDAELPGPRQELHPDLAVLLSTSGSTGSPKLVRLSRENLRSNAASIAEYLDLGPGDCAATTLPLQYCYGLSVLNSHLLAGASVLLTEDSVVEDRFWVDAAAAEVTSFAGVPHTFALLDASGFARRRLPSLRTITQAGGRMDPATVRRYADLGRERGFDLVVMYGQTEATARMAYLPPHLVDRHPQSIGIPIPGGSLRIDGDAEVGELVYSGANVMMGYAHGREDLALGPTLRELRTGDLARRNDDGLYELVGRSSRFAKVFGLRVDLDRLENMGAERLLNMRVVEHEGRLHAFVTGHSEAAGAREVIEGLGLPGHAVDLHVLQQLPLTAHGKPDRAALVEHARAVARDRFSAAGESGATQVCAADVRDLLARLLGRPDATEDDSFVSLRGDSLSYVEASVRLGALVPELPGHWSQLSAHELAALVRPDRPKRRAWWVPVETGVVLRALAIVLIVGSHANLLSVMGGAHVLLAIAGFNLARFQLSSAPRAERRRSLFRAARNVALPAGLWIGGVALVTGMYDASTALMLNGLLGSDGWDVQWQFWFLEVVVWVLVLAAVVVPSAWVDRFERGRPFAFATGVLVAALALRYGLVGLEAGPTERYTLPVVLWCVGLGWMAARAADHRQRLITTAAAVVASWGFFGDPVREALVAAGVVLLVWIPSVHLPRSVLPVVSAVAGSSLFVYLTHWQVYPHLEVDHPLLATLASFVVGYVVWRGWSRVLVGRHG